MFELDQKIDKALLANDKRAIAVQPAKLTTHQCWPSHCFKIQLWQQRVELLNQRIGTATPPTIPLPGTISGGQLKEATAEHIILVQGADDVPTILPWSELTTQQLTRLCERYDLETRPSRSWPRLPCFPDEWSAWRC